MSNKTNFTSLVQLSTYSGFKDFLTQYHQEVKKEFGQFLGVNKSLIAASKVFEGFKNQHEMKHKMENNDNIIKLRKEIISVVFNEKIDDYKYDTKVNNFQDINQAEKIIKERFYSLAIAKDLNKDGLFEYFIDYYTEEESINFKDFTSFLDDILKNKDIDIYDFIYPIENITNDDVNVCIGKEFVDIIISEKDIIDSI